MLVTRVNLYAPYRPLSVHIICVCTYILYLYIITHVSACVHQFFVGILLNAYICLYICTQTCRYAPCLHTHTHTPTCFVVVVVVIVAVVVVVVA